ncbi:MAG: hypothetical protein H3C34_22830 [Caldilineaceae bacterium]|nr:hypothetical protein [Caldilineaceae bacterium]
MSRQKLHQSEQQGSIRMRPVDAMLPAADLNISPLHIWRGFFVAFAYRFSFYFYGFRKMPARAGALRMPA